MLNGNYLRTAVELLDFEFEVLLDDDRVIRRRGNVEAHDDVVAWRLIVHLVDGAAWILREKGDGIMTVSFEIKDVIIEIKDDKQ